MDGLFSSRVITVCGIPEEAQQRLYPIEALSMERAVEKRQIEFTAGRTLARRALHELGFGDVAVPVGGKREPVWPLGVVGSISHTKGFCGVAVARSSEVRGLGFDAERIEDVRLELRPHIASGKELAAIQQSIGGSLEQALALAFSAKEAFFKFQYPLSHQWVDLRDAEVRAEGDRLTLVPSLDVANVCKRGDAIPCRFRVGGGYVMTAVEVAPDQGAEPLNELMVTG